MSDGAMHFGEYGKQRGWVRAGSSQESRQRGVAMVYRNTKADGVGDTI